MTSLPPNADELVSAYVDGEAAPDEITLIESTPELMAQVDALRNVSHLIGAPVAPPQEQKEAHLAAALGAFDELFAPNPDEGTSETATPLLSAAPTPSTVSVNSAPIDDADKVTSLATARERRRPRRFNTGIIAAAVAALLLFVGVAALSLGGSTSEDVATSSITEASSDDASDASDDAMADEEEAMVDEEEAASASDTAGGLSDADSLNRAEALPAPTAPLPAAAQAAPSDEADADEAMADEAMDDEAMDDEEAGEAAADSDAGDSALSSGVDVRADFLFGDFATEDALKSQLEEFTVLDLELRGAEIGQGLFPRCQRSIPELANIETPTLVGDAFIAQQVFEVHYVSDPDGGATVYIVNPDQCSIQLTVPIVP